MRRMIKVQRKRGGSLSVRDQSFRRQIRGLDRVLVIARISQTAAFTFLPTSMVFNEKVVVFTFDDHDLK